MGREASEEVQEIVVRLTDAARADRIDDADFGRLFERFHRRVYWSFPPGSVTLEDRRDLTQEVFFAVYRGLKGCSADSFEPWLARIARNVFLNWIERQGRLKRRAPEVSLQDLKSNSLAVTDEGTNPYSDTRGSELMGRINAAIEEFPPQMRRCAKLRFGEDLGIDEIARFMRIAPGTVKAHLHQARERLREVVG